MGLLGKLRNGEKRILRTIWSETQLLQKIIKTIYFNSSTTIQSRIGTLSYNRSRPKLYICCPRHIFGYEGKSHPKIGGGTVTHQGIEILGPYSCVDSLPLNPRNYSLGACELFIRG